MFLRAILLAVVVGLVAWTLLNGVWGHEPPPSDNWREQTETVYP